MMDKKIPELTCPIVRDLLPLYHDGVVSDETSEAIEKHIDRCADCAVELKHLDEELPLPKNSADINGGFRRMVKKNKKKRRILYAVFFLAGAAVILSAAIWFMRTQQIIPYAASEIKAFEVHRCERDSSKLYILMEFPVAADVEETREDGVLELHYKHPIWNPQMYAAGEVVELVEIELQDGDKKLRINGSDVCDIGEPEREGEYPAYYDAYFDYEVNEEAEFYIAYDGYDIENDKLLGRIVYSPDGVEGNYTVWDMYGNEMDTNSGADAQSEP